MTTGVVCKKCQTSVAGKKWAQGWFTCRGCGMRLPNEAGENCGIKKQSGTLTCKNLRLATYRASVLSTSISSYLPLQWCNCNIAGLFSHVKQIVRSSLAAPSHVASALSIQ
eukprot:1606683-Amphidinium_carterae.1